ncbi:MAG TPA: RdgB/HAM1 family non-canonical purine NTP pyrophosphatase [Luteibaculaceae bacterium]|nr:RdgB/HAM1 family non-canonical purine NTP pyrophosphatase [Luteibaculaceae bacterium]
MNKPTLIIASNNKHKVEEIRDLLADYYACISMRDAGIHLEVDETADTFRGNALLKAQAVFEISGADCLADDSGLEVDALDGAPGVFSARYAGPKASDTDNVAKLLTELEGKDDRSARFVCSLMLISDGLPYLFEGKVDGVITREPKGNQGFGYDPVFVPLGYDQSFAELGADVKNTISHRAHAVEGLLRFLKAR